MNTPPKRFVKILYVQEQVHEKSWCHHLAELTSAIQPTCLFTVVTNAFSALEQLEITRFDLVIVQRNLPQFHAMELVKIMRRLRCLTPFIVVSEQNHFSSIVEEVNLQPDFFGTVGLLSKTYTGHDLRYAIYTTLRQRIPTIKDTSMDCPMQLGTIHAAPRITGRKRKHTPFVSEPSFLSAPPRLHLHNPIPADDRRHAYVVDENYLVDSPFSRTTVATRTTSFESFESFLSHGESSSPHYVETQGVASAPLSDSSGNADDWLDFLFHALA